MQQAVSVRQAAARIGVHPATIARWIARGVIRAPRVEGRRLVPVAELDRLLSASSDRVTEAVADAESDKPD